ncbi:HipA domain-containing protein [Rhodoferax antarcticus]|uniref:hypothetical protein n=1 Tax=Rhodoferax antarcticus TaxID=81479 RepID=UPI00222414B4|nr:hypothetical protein [Rhodoferax antarcticus]MCW2312590.1 hypothetical protein [Rhodoferax antarcticus]
MKQVFDLLLADPKGLIGVRPHLTPHLTPLNAVCPRLTDKMAMKIGSKYKFSDVQARHWVQFANDAQLSPAQAKKRLLDIAKRLPDLARSTQAALEAQGNGHPTLGQIATLIDQRCTLTIRRLKATEVFAAAAARVAAMRCCIDAPPTRWHAMPFW